MPLFIIFFILLPIFLLLKLFLIHKNKSFHKLGNLVSYGYLYSEYNNKAYFWEIVKVCLKNFMNIVVSFYS